MIMLPKDKVEVIEDFEVRLNIGGQKFDRNFNCQNLGLMLIVFVYISSFFGAVHSLNVRRNLKRKKSLKIINKPFILGFKVVQGR